MSTLNKAEQRKLLKETIAKQEKQIQLTNQMLEVQQKRLAMLISKLKRG